MKSEIGRRIRSSGWKAFWPATLQTFDSLPNPGNPGN
ncbi:unnamed protein product [Anisakis simplex]|uniref:Uncharacterized protein n=1 Tax=Anisakis simplex TaxID=6269 RepID=A0A0M3JFX1_ANISI|nr:unnamed protein product [Anisakis simplex]